MKNLLIRVSMIVALLAAGLTAYAQTTVRGTVKDATGNGAIGASVFVQGTQNGTIVSPDGSYVLSNAKVGDKIEFSCIGYAPQVITWQGGPLNVVLAEDAEMLEGTVVTALGIRRDQKALGYAVTELKSEELNPNLINPVSALQGKVAGVEINASDGGMFGRSKILIRGASTLGKNNQPIFVVDGIILDNDVVDPSADWSADNLDYGNALRDGLHPEGCGRYRPVRFPRSERRHHHHHQERQGCPRTRCLLHPDIRFRQGHVRSGLPECVHGRCLESVLPVFGHADAR